MARRTRSYKQNLVRDKGHHEVSPAKEEVFTIFGGPYEVRRNRNSHDEYAQEARRPPSTLVHRSDVHLIRDTTGESKDIIFIDIDVKCVHYPHTNALVVTVKIANSIIHRILVDNDSATNILFWDGYRMTGLTQADLSPITSPLYGFTEDHMISKGTIKLAVTFGEHPRVTTVVTEFLVVDCPSTFNGVIGREMLRTLKASSSIHYLTMKFPITVGVGQVQGKQWDSRECYNKSLKLA